MKTKKTLEEVSSHPGEKWLWTPKSHRNFLCAGEEWMADRKKGQEKRLANLRTRTKVKKKAHAGRGQEIKWEIPV
jgi:hypothetical protein